ncbi:MAG: sulfate adenylyltransferase [Gammaproteobacteria bacterium]|nr:sulfate adenylyltransferase [Gammaproteobacteria bacterium]
MTVTGKLKLTHIFIILISLVGIGVTASLVIDEKMLVSIEQQYGMDARKRVVAWNRLIMHNQMQTEKQKLELVNRFFNRVTFIADKKHWNKHDYWATPIEFLVTNGGDCEDFSIAKYFALKELGISTRKLRLTYVKSIKLNQAHMVLSYFDSPGAEPLILDNLTQKIELSSIRKDLIPVYSFNGEGLWMAKERGAGRLVGKARQVSPWMDVIKRMQFAKAGL